MIIIYNDKPAFFSPSLLPTLSPFLLVRHFSIYVLKKSIILVSSILYRIYFLILHMLCYDYGAGGRKEVKSPHMPPETLVLWLPDPISFRYVPSRFDLFSALFF